MSINNLKAAIRRYRRLSKTAFCTLETDQYHYYKGALTFYQETLRNAKLERRGNRRPNAKLGKV